MRTIERITLGVVFATVSLSGCTQRSGSGDAGPLDCATTPEAGQTGDGGRSCVEVGCLGLSWCDAASGECKPGCASDVQCGPNEMCDTVVHSCVCDAGFHSCRGSCVSNSAVTSCGQICSACPSASLATASCDGTQCLYTCQSNARNCGSECVACPTQGVSATTCSGNACVASACSSGYLLCGNTCSLLDFFSSLLDAGTWSLQRIATGLDGTVHVSYYDRTASKMKVAQKPIGGTWASLALDANDTPHISYSISGSQSGAKLQLLKYATLNGGSWSSITVEVINVPEAFSSLTFDAVGNPHVAYWNAVPDGHVRYAH